MTYGHTTEQNATRVGCPATELLLFPMASYIHIYLMITSIYFSLSVGQTTRILALTENTVLNIGNDLHLLTVTKPVCIKE